MTKRQWFLVAGTLVLAACGSGTAPCLANDETGEVSCESKPIVDQGLPATSVDTDEP